MIAEPTDPFLAALRQFNLLEPARVAELTAWAEQTHPDARDWARELLRRGWMTPYQIKHIYHGRGAELVLGPYILLDLLGEGGMGRVFKAHHPRLGREIALKVIRKEKVAKPAVVERFNVEIRAAAKLSHPNVVLALDADEAGGIHYFAMEYVEGTDLTRLVRERGPLPMSQACDYMRQAALGLQHAHERRLVHRDVKPSNLLVTPRGQVKVLDLGLALLKRDASGESGHRMTQEGLILGTPDFLAPEQARNPLGVDGRADVYALGATLFYLLAGRVPYDGETPADKLIQHVTAPPPSLLRYRPDAPPQLDALIQWMMAKRPEDRPQTAAQAAAALSPFCHPALGTLPPPNYAPPPADAAPDGETLAFDAPTQTPREPRSAYRRSTSSGAGVKLAIFALVGLCGLLAVGGIGYVLWNTFGSDAPLPTEFTNVAGMKMIRLPGGSFVMGSPDGEPGRDRNEGPAGEVALAAPFYMSATEVSEGQFLQIMGTSPAKWPRKMRKPATTPVDSVTWDEANEFGRKLTQLDGHRRSGWAYRLPTEAEWEYACRAGTTTPFWSGDKLILGKQAIFNLDKELDEKGDLGEPDLSKPPIEKNLPYPVGSTEANPFGLFDMSGNVWEWCADYYAPNYDNRAAENPKGPDTGDWRVLRGGSWRETAGRARSAARRGLSPTHREEDVGFRVVFAPAK